MAARQIGLEFCFLRVGRGKASTATDAAGLDTRWLSYARDADASGFRIGGYWRFYPSVDMAKQINSFVGRLNDAPVDLPAMVDVEDQDGFDRDALTDWTLQALTAVQARDRTGRKPLLYTNRSFLNDRLDATRLTGFPLALARWTPDPTWPVEQPVFWQYAGDVTVSWSSGRVDLQRTWYGVESGTA